MLQFENLVIPELTKIIEDLLESTRIGFKLSYEEFVSLLEKENQAIFDLVDDKLTDVVIDKIGPDYVDQQRVKFQKNQQTILNDHKELFHFYFLFVHSAHNIFNTIWKKLDKTEAKLNDVIPICLLGELCRMSDEIGNALSNGATRAALAQWRIFYEHAVIGVFLMRENSPELFQKFADFSHRDLKKQKDSFDNHYEELKFPPLTNELEVTIDERTVELTQTYGKEFFEDYAWAKDALPQKGRASFWKIEMRAKMGQYRPFYIWASNYIHPNFTAITHMDRGEQKLTLNRITAPVTERQSFIDPMQLTTVIFYRFLDYFLHRYSVNSQYSTNLLVFRKIIDRLQSKFDSH